MKLFPYTFRIFAVSALLLSITSCVSELDFDQVNEIVITPKVDLDLIFLNLETEDFIDADNTVEGVVVRDTTRLEFLNDAVVRENLKEIEFTFTAENTFPQAAMNRAQFLNNAGVLQYELFFDIEPSPDGNLVVTTLVEVLSEVEIEALRNSIQVVNEVIVEVNGSPIEGQLSIQSKALYSLEIKTD